VWSTYVEDVLEEGELRLLAGGEFAGVPGVLVEEERSEIAPRLAGLPL
jgi:hypothetical protein